MPRVLAGIFLALALVVSLVAGSAGLAAVAAVGILSSDLPDPSSLGSLTFAQPTVIYDRTGEVQLGVFQREKRRVVAFADVPHLVLDATTTAEDRSFWKNGGFDPAAILAAAAENANGDSSRGASTITQQLVRARLLPPDVTAAGANRYLRKAKELIQSSRLTATFPGEEGKEEIVTAYLNEIFYGHDAYGIAAAAEIYFGVKDLSELTPAQAALLAGLPKSPSTLDPYRYAERDAEGRLVVPSTAAARRPTRLDPQQPLVVALDDALGQRAEARPRRTGGAGRRRAARTSGRRTSPGRSAASSTRSSRAVSPSRPAATR